MSEVTITAREVLDSLTRGHLTVFSLYQSNLTWPSEMLNGNILPITPDFGVKATNTGGTGNGGDCIIVGISKGGRATVRNLKINSLIREGVSEKTALQAIRMAYGMESAVAKTADILTRIPLTDPPKGHNDWAYRLGDIGDGLTFPRKLAAWNIAKQAQSQ